MKKETKKCIVVELDRTGLRPIQRFVPIDLIYPNPLNPRADVRDDVEHLKWVLQTQGWREPLTVHPYGNQGGFMLESGHRRLQAAKELGLKEIPVFISAVIPESEEERVRDIALHQGTRKDWTVVEWAKTAYNAWLHLGKPAYTVVARSLGKRVEPVGHWINVFNAFSAKSIEDKLINGTFSIAGLFETATWVNKMQKYKPELFLLLSEKYIKELMLSKLENKRTSSASLKNDRFVEVATNDQLKDFLLNKKAYLKVQQELLGVDKEDNDGHFRAGCKKIQSIQKNIESMDCFNNDEQINEYLAELQELVEIANKKCNTLLKLKQKKENAKSEIEQNVREMESLIIKETLRHESRMQEFGVK